jgi:Mn2+/Fe2+ NRAMP family transporter
MAGCLATVVVAFFIIVACASTLHKNGVVIEHAADAALALKPLAGHFASKLFAFGLLTASVFSAVILPLAASFYICEAFGFEAGIDRKMGEAPQFYALFASIIALSAGIILIPGAPLIKITIWTQVLNGALLPVALVSIMMIVNKREIMGNYTNTPFQNAIGWTTITLLIGLTAYLVITPLVT